MQTKFGKGEGNCLLAAVASVLRRPLESIPDFSMSGCGWFDELYEWCLNENIALLCCDPKDFEHSIFVNAYGIGIFRVVGIEDENHAVVMKCQRKEIAVREHNAKRPTIEEMEALLDAEPTTPVHIRGDGTVVSWEWSADIVHNPNPSKDYKLGDLVHLIFLIPSAPIPLAKSEEQDDAVFKMLAEDGHDKVPTN